MTPYGKKGQIFIVTMVFLIGLIFSVQQLLVQYTAIDLSLPPRSSDSYFMKNMESSFQAALDSSTGCNETRTNIEELKNLITQGVREGHSVDISGDLNCPGGGWPSPPELTVTVNMKGDTSETRARFELSRTP
jgi:hypothetical protein